MPVVVVPVERVAVELNSRREQARGWIMWMPPMGMSRLGVEAARWECRGRWLSRLCAGRERHGWGAVRGEMSCGDFACAQSVGSWVFAWESRDPEEAPALGEGAILGRRHRGGPDPCEELLT